jgi:prepilin-type N-terminal cleavage/methylation domain-containing protein
VNELRPKGFTVIELLVVVAVLGALAAILLPAIQAARESARRVQCQNNLRQIAMGVELHHDAHSMYPPARLVSRPVPGETTCGETAATWLVRILPFVEYQDLYSLWDVYASWHQHTAPARTSGVPLFLCPSRRTVDKALTAREFSESRTKVFIAACGCRFPMTTTNTISVRGTATDYAGNHGDLSPGATGAASDFYFGGNGTGVIIGSRPRCVERQVVKSSVPKTEIQAAGWLDRVRHKDVPDGLSMTFLVGEKHVPAAKLSQFPEDGPAFDGDHFPAASRVAGVGAPLARGPTDEDPASVITFGSAHRGICNMAMADGSVRPFSVHTSTRTLAEYAHRSNR